jgi:surface protein
MNKKVLAGLLISGILAGTIGIGAIIVLLPREGEEGSNTELLFLTQQEDGLNIPAGVFSTVWNTSKTTTGSTGSDQVKLPLHSAGTYNFTVDWGDGTNDTITKWNASAATHTYLAEGVYTVDMNGTIIGWCFNYTGDKEKLLEIRQWGTFRLGNSGYYFYGCKNMKINARDTLTLTGTTTLTYAFAICDSVNEIRGIEDWDVSNVTNMRAIFFHAISFNQDIGGWNMSRVVNTGGMFLGASSFNQDIGDWDVSNVRIMDNMFGVASSFNQDIGDWDVSRVKDMKYMFYNARSFNQNIGGWNVSDVLDMKEMFCRASYFDQDLGNWKVSNVADMTDMFEYVQLSTPNYDSLLIGWSNLTTLQSNVQFHGGTSQYSVGEATHARNQLTDIAGYNWTITDGGQT